MRIDKTGQIVPPGAVGEGGSIKKPAAKGARSSFNTDRVEFTGGPSIGFMQSVVRGNIINLQKQGISAERLESIRQRISRNSYYVNTDDIVKAMLM